MIDVNIDCAVKLIGTNCIIYPVNSKDLQHIWVSGCVASVLLLLPSIVLMGQMAQCLVTVASLLQPASGRLHVALARALLDRRSECALSRASVQIMTNVVTLLVSYQPQTRAYICLFVCLFYVGILQEYSLCVLLECLIPEVGVGSLGTKIRESCEPLCGCWEWTQVLSKNRQYS